MLVAQWEIDFWKTNMERQCQDISRAEFSKNIIYKDGFIAMISFGGVVYVTS